MINLFINVKDDYDMDTLLQLSRQIDRKIYSCLCTKSPTAALNARNEQGSRSGERRYSESVPDRRHARESCSICAVFKAIDSA